MTKYFQLSHLVYGSAQSFVAIGAFFSPLLVVLMKRKFALLQSLVVARVLKLLPFLLLLLVVLSQNATSNNIYLIGLVAFCTVSFLGSLFNTTGFTFLQTFFQQRVDAQYLGRFTSIRYVCYSLAELVGMNVLGLLFESHVSFAIVMIVAGICLEALLLYVVKRMQRTSVDGVEFEKIG